MKVALCISNHLRSFENAFPSLKSAIIDRYKPDVFIASWDRQGFDGVRGDNRVLNTLVSLDRLVELFNPKAVSIESSRKWEVSKYKCHSGVRDANIIFGMFYSIWKSNELKKEFEYKHNFKYDVVIRSRADLLFNNTLELDKKQTIYIPSFGGYGGYCDSFAHGPSDLMDLYANTYNNIDNLYDAGANFQGEQMLKANLEKYKVPITKSHIKYSLLRANEMKFELAP